MNRPQDFNDTFYPTPPELARKMWGKIPADCLECGTILEPSAGDGALVEASPIVKLDRHDEKTLKGLHRFRTIEKDPKLVSILQGKGITVIDHDFLNYSGRDNFDVIIANPPFDQGEKHLFKAIEVMYEGHIVFLLNAETIKNPSTNTRKQLVDKLDNLGASIEYIESAFTSTETLRKTAVEVALIHIHIEAEKIGDDVTEGLTSCEEVDADNPEGGKELARKNSIVEMVADFNRKADIGTKTIVDFYENRHHIGGLIRIEVDFDAARHGDPVATYSLQADLNKFLVALRRDYWQKALKLDVIEKRMTVAKRKEFMQGLTKNAFMDFTVSNVQQFALNMIDGYEETLTAAVVDLFDRVTRRHHWDEQASNKTIHYFDGWKTNDAFMVNPKVIIPFWGDNVFLDWNGRWSVGYTVEDELNDIDKVMSYFDGGAEYVSIVDALKAAFIEGQSRKVESTYFIIDVFKKGTCHLTFRSEDIRRRFNVTACKGKNWLPHDYGTKKYSDMNQQERKTANSFEGMKSYIKNINLEGKSLFASKGNLQITG